MSNAETRYQARIAFPEMIERARTQTLALDTFLDGAVAAPSSGTITIYDRTDTAVVDADAVTVASSRATYSLTAATIPATTALSTGWRVEWALVMGDGVTHTFRRDAFLCLRVLQTPITNQDLLDEYTDLSNLKSSPTTAYQTYIDAAWKRVLAKLVSQGIYPQRIVSPWSLRAPMFDLTMAIIYRDFYATVGGADGKYLALSQLHQDRFDKMWSELNFAYDEDEDGDHDDPDRRTAAGANTWLTDKPTTRRWSW